MRKSVVDSIIKEHYKSVLKYCSKHLHGDIHATVACAQEFFPTLYQKVNSLDMTKDIRLWLYRTADRVMKKCSVEQNKQKAQIISFQFYPNIQS